ncbi:hypothetical protein EXE48_11625 [Halorubrum sp. ASP1]|jgi:hypothetical protein|uniref:hypothetical protein n=1 Tax=Halorubrum sp. ASP1 TaxID=2518114 RepID=UPI0010F4388C|nr:hypothetical protein [Halorubrum sp. ASP1]TKX60615.1 hypothetical protein EXE48_11625 [Halorubrum sp. ASP1]
MTTDTHSIDPSLINEHPPSWLGCQVRDLEVELPSGGIATGMSISRTEATFNVSESFGTGTTPYAEIPETHEEYLDGPDVESTEGYVEYQREDDTVKLPKQVFFEYSFEFETPIDAETPTELASQVESRLNDLDVVSQPVSVSPPEGTQREVSIPFDSIVAGTDAEGGEVHDIQWNADGELVIAYT